MSRRDQSRTLVLGPDDEPPWRNIDLRDKTDPAAFFHREMFWWFERNSKTFDRVIAPCPIKQDLFEGERTHEIVLKQAVGSRVNIRCLQRHRPADVLHALLEQLKE